MDANHEDSVFYTEPYDFNDQTNEPRPNTVVYQEPYTVLMQLNHEGVCHLQDPLKESPYQNAITNGLLRDVQNRTKQDFPDEAMFAIAGDMESGKYWLDRRIEDMLMVCRQEHCHQLHIESRHYCAQGKSYGYIFLRNC